MGKSCEEMGLMLSRILDATLVFLCVAPQQLCRADLPAPILQVRSARLGELRTLTVDVPEHVRVK